LKDLTFHYGVLNTSEQISTSLKRTKILEYAITKKAKTPAANHLMEHQHLPLLPDQLQGQLRSGIAKLLDLSINTHPDISLPVNYIWRFDSDD
jgi:hypothetical protein